MPRVELTSHLARHVDCPPEDVAGTTLREVLNAYLAKHPKVRSYVFDEQGALRRHVVLFVGDTQAHDRRGLSDAVAPIKPSTSCSRFPEANRERSLVRLDPQGAVLVRARRGW